MRIIRGLVFVIFCGLAACSPHGGGDAGPLQESSYALSCTESSQCGFGPQPYCTCLTATACQCTSNCAVDSDCGPGFACVANLSALAGVDGGALNGCVQTCTSTPDCADGFACNQSFVTTADGGVQACALGCDNAQDCASGFCDSITGACVSAQPPDAGPPADAGSPATTHGDSCEPFDPGNSVCATYDAGPSWVQRVQLPIILPGQAAGFNMEQDGGLLSTDPSVSCAGWPSAPGVPDGDFGGNGEVDMELLAIAGCVWEVDYIGLGTDGEGYLGTMTVTSPDGTTVSVLSLQNATPIMQQVGTNPPAPVVLDWEGYFGGTNSTAIVPFDEFYRAIMSTFFHAEWAANPEPPGVTCDTTGACVLGQFAAYYAYFSIPSAGFGFWVSAYLTQAGQYPDRVDVYKL